ncbi:MAG: carboxypeptidase regulatory-like domain-containing protein [Caldilineaceae bacterium]|nr:carboxypeptidase regulatory-like domain-containing protein [Caldilineaceae bacterium]HRJ42765.1 carboxypeptidase regulatory-like domain-containing protein [Caldilineaceae bacterium]
MTQRTKGFSASGWLCILLLLPLLAGCAPTPQANVLGYLVGEELGGNRAGPPSGWGTIEGRVEMDGRPAPGVSVLVAERTGEPHAATTDSQGHYRIERVPPGQYVVAAVGAQSEESSLTGGWGIPWLVTVQDGQVSVAPHLLLQPHVAPLLPSDLAASVELWAGVVYTAAAPFPAGSVARVQAFSFQRAGQRIDTLRVYRPLEDRAEPLPLIFGLFPGSIDGWSPVSVAFAAAGYVVIALSPSGSRGLDVYAHAEDARTVLHLARQGALGVDVADVPAVAMGGSFSSAILHRLLRDEGEAFAAWVTVGGISNAFSGSADFYAGRLDIPDPYGLVIPALGPANVFPVPFLRFSPVYTAAHLPPTLIIHTDADAIIPINQAYQLEAALRAANVPVEVFYYRDVSHYLQIGEDITEAGQAMYWLVMDFVYRYTQPTESRPARNE